MPRSKSGGGEAVAAKAAAVSERSATSRRVPKGGVFTRNLANAEKEAATADLAAVARAPLSAFAPHPFNPDRRHTGSADLAELAEDLRRSGILQPIIVASRAAVVRHAPELAEEIDAAADWVILAGHRRWAAAELAGLAELPHLVRDDLADPRSVVGVLLRENILRQALSAVEEARGYRRLEKEYGLKQRAIAQQSGVSQSRVSKAMALLKLPEEVQAAIDDGAVAANAVRPLLDLPTGERAAAYRAAITEVKDAADTDTDNADENDEGRTAALRAVISATVRRRTAELKRQEAVAQAKADLKKRGINLVEPHEVEQQKAVHRITADEAKAGDEVIGAHVDDTGRVTYYAPTVELELPSSAATSPKPTAAKAGDGKAKAKAPADSNGIKTPVSAVEHADLERMRARLKAAEAAHDARCDAIRRMVADMAKLSPAVVLDVLAEAVLTWEHIVFDAIELAQEVTDAEIDYVDGRARPDSHRAALALALCAAEIRAANGRDGDVAWQPEVRRYVERLIELGYYTATDYDTERLAR